MSNPLFDAMGKQNNQNPLLYMANDMKKLSQQLNGRSPADQIQQMMQSGKIQKSQVDQAYAIANRLAGSLSQFFKG